jgi:O-antigen chain-terminating methyltransferase
MKDGNFYFDFENRHRGTREQILERLKFYEPLVRFIAKKYSNEKPKAVDLGCGRGEFLEFLINYGFEVEGVDINKENIKLVKELGLSATEGDILKFLKGLSEKKYELVSLIHVIEHLPFEYTFQLFSEVSRVLKPGGIFIVEFPYTKNLMIGAYSFWIDPTHLRPVHPELLEFIGKRNGLIISKSFPINGVKKIDSFSIESLFYFSPDVSVVFVKDSENELYLENVKEVLTQLSLNASLDFEDVANLLKRDLRNLDHKLNFLSEKFAKEMEPQLLDLQSKLTAIWNKLNFLSEKFAKEMEPQLLDLQSKLTAIWNSKPWRFYRWLGKKKRSLFNFIKKIKFFFNERLFIHLASYLNSKPKLKETVKFLIKKMPAVERKLKSKINKLNTSPSNFQENSEQILITNYEAQIFNKRLKRWKEQKE